jgi:hypothetical protein
MNCNGYVKMKKIHVKNRLKNLTSLNGNVKGYVTDLYIPSIFNITVPPKNLYSQVYTGWNEIKW